MHVEGQLPDAFHFSSPKLLLTQSAAHSRG
jgi:hypothetical protein